MLTNGPDKALRQALRHRPGRRARTISDIVRATLDDALIERRADLRAARLLTALLRPAGNARRRKGRRVL